MSAGLRATQSGQTALLNQGGRHVGANSQQGWSLMLFLIGFTFLPAGLFALGPIFTIAGLACLIVGLVWTYRLKPLEQAEANKSPEAANQPKKRAVWDLGPQAQSQEEKMRIVGLLVCLLGWLLAVMSVKVPGVYLQILVAAAGFVVAAIGTLAIVNRAHLKDAIWKAWKD
jgi:hypothetical protein